MAGLADQFLPVAEGFVMVGRLMEENLVKVQRLYDEDLARRREPAELVARGGQPHPLAGYDAREHQLRASLGVPLEPPHINGHGAPSAPEGGH